MKDSKEHPMRRATGILIVAATVLACIGDEASSAPPHLNVLLIAIDDLRPMLGCYGDRTVQSPRIDAFAATATRFDRAYCQFALCNPSRSSLLAGRRPETLGVFTLAKFLRDGNPDVVTLPEHFRTHGYETRSYGKIFHVTNGNHDDERSWTVPPWPARKPVKLVASGTGGPADETADHSDDEPAAAAEGSDDDLADGKIAARAVAALGEMKDEPFFLAVGFHKPHLPFVAPQQYWDRYDPAALTLPSNPTLPEAAPAFVSNDSAELRRYKGIPKAGPPVTDADARRLIHGYHACVSYVDAQVGRVLDELDRLGLAGSTVVVLWADHGYHLGEQGTWTKRTTWENATRVPLVIRCPGRGTAGARVGSIVELLDVYPTLVDLCELPMPAKLEGRSLAPLLVEPDRAWPNVARSLIVKQSPELGGAVTGRAIRTARYRWIEWTGETLASPVQELYDHDVDPAESQNIADTPSGREAIAVIRSHHGG
jgi:arylsulfatase A-like enzyme